MEDKSLNDAYDSFWNYNNKKVCVNKSITPKRFPSKRRLGQEGRVPLSVNRRHRILPVNPGYSDVRSIRNQADFYMAQKRLYQAKAAARKAGYRSPSEKALDLGKVAGKKTVVGVGAAIGRVVEASKGSDWKEKIRLLRGKSIYD
jgi:hypothetical protein